MPKFKWPWKKAPVAQPEGTEAPEALDWRLVDKETWEKEHPYGVRIHDQKLIIDIAPSGPSGPERYDVLYLDGDVPTQIDAVRIDPKEVILLDKDYWERRCKYWPTFLDMARNGAPAEATATLALICDLCNFSYGINQHELLLMRELETTYGETIDVVVGRLALFDEHEKTMAEQRRLANRSCRFMVNQFVKLVPADNWEAVGGNDEDWPCYRVDRLLTEDERILFATTELSFLPDMIVNTKEGKRMAAFSGDYVLSHKPPIKKESTDA